MKNILLLALTLTSTSAFAASPAKWTCKGAYDLKTLTFEISPNHELTHVALTAPDWGNVNQSLKLVNSFTLVANGLVSTSAQESLDLTFLLDEEQKHIEMKTVWSVSPVIGSETLPCTVTDL